MTDAPRTAPAPGAALAPGLLRSRIGSVATFDEAVGVGEVAGEDGSLYPFHCSAIAGGSRTIEVGTPVRFVLGSYHGGILQAEDLTPLPAARN